MRINWLVLIGLVFFNITFILGFAIALYAIIASVWIVLAAFIASPFLLFLVNITNLQNFAFYQTIFSFFLFGGALYLVPVCLKLTRKTIELTMNYLNYNKDLVYGQTF